MNGNALWASVTTPSIIMGKCTKPRETRTPDFTRDYVPPYSPDLNPVERVWKLTRKRCLHDQYCPTLAGVIATVEKEFTAWALGSVTVKRLCAPILNEWKIFAPIYGRAY